MNLLLSLTICMMIVVINFYYQEYFYSSKSFGSFVIFIYFMNTLRDASFIKITLKLGNGNRNQETILRSNIFVSVLRIDFSSSGIDSYY